MEACEGLRIQIGLQKQLHEQLEVCTSYSELVREDVRTFIYFTDLGSFIFPSIGPEKAAAASRRTQQVPGEGDHEARREPKTAWGTAKVSTCKHTGCGSQRNVQRTNSWRGREPFRKEMTAFQLCTNRKDLRHADRLKKARLRVN
jgi:hypothetical protein